MSLFNRSNSLHQRHAKAHALAQNAADYFRQLADDFRTAGELHDEVADQATDQMNELRNLRDSAALAAADAKRKADAVASLVS